MAEKKNGKHRDAIETPAVPAETQTSLVAPDPGAPGALAILPAEIAGAFTPEEWATMSVEDRASALTFFREEAERTTEGVTVEFPRVKYPTSGASFWEIPDPLAEGGVRAVKALEGIVVFKQPVRAWWPIEVEIGNNPPECSSLDGAVPTSGQGPTGAKTCAACPHAQWGSGKDGRGQACKARLNVFILMDGEEIPTLISLPPSQLKAFGQFAVQMRKSRVPGGLIGVTTVFGLVEAKSGAGIAYKGVSLKVGQTLRFAEMRRATGIRNLFEREMAKRGVRVDEVVHDDEPGNGAEGAEVATPAADPKAGF